MQPYVICQGDDLLLLAHRFGFNADTVWNDPANAKLRDARPNPQILYPSDILYIPDQLDKEPTSFTLNIGAMNSFVAEAPPVRVTLKFVDPDLTSQPFTISELPDLTGLSTGGDGSAAFSIPVTLRVVSIVFTSSGATFAFNVGHLDPIGTLSGVTQRLQNLGFLSRDVPIDGITAAAVRPALVAFKSTQGPPPDDAPIPPASPDATADPGDAGLSNQGVLESATANLLVAAAGS